MSMQDFNSITQDFIRILAEQGPEQANAYMEGAVAGARATCRPIPSNPATGENRVAFRSGDSCQIMEGSNE